MERLRGHFILLWLIFGVISSTNTSYPTDLEYVPHQNTTFSCIGRDNDKETGLTFAINNSIYGIPVYELGSHVKFVGQIRTRLELTRLNITTTLTFSKEANGFLLRCCYFNGTQIFWRECFRLVCIWHCTTTTHTTEDYGSFSMKTGISTDSSTDGSHPISIVLPVVSVVVFIGAILLAACCLYRCAKNRDKNSPREEVNTYVEMEVSQSTRSEGTGHRMTQYPVKAAVRSDLDSLECQDNMPPTMTSVPGRCERRVVNAKEKTEPARYMSESKDQGTETIRLIVNPNNPEKYHIQEKLTEVHGISLPQNKAEELLMNAGQEALT